jgi:hypothetical protein
MHHRLHPVLSLPFLAVPALAQGSYQVPAGYAAVEGESAILAPFQKEGGRAMFVVNENGLAGLTPGSLMRALRFRADAAANTPARTADVEILASSSFRPWIVDGAFARHRGPDHSVVFARRQVQLPAATASGGPSTHRVEFLLDAPKLFWGPSLCIEVVNHATSATDWPIDGVIRPGTGFGTSQAYGASCPPARNHLTGNDVPWPLGVPVWQLSLTEPETPHGVTLLAWGLSNQQSFGMPLPLDLDPLLGTQGCRLLASFEWVFPMLVVNGRADFVMPKVEDEPAIEGVSFYFQHLVLDPNLPGSLGVSNGLRATIGVRPLGSCGLATNPAATEMNAFLPQTLVVEIGQ